MSAVPSSSSAAGVRPERSGAIGALWLGVAAAVGVGALLVSAAMDAGGHGSVLRPLVRLLLAVAATGAIGALLAAVSEDGDRRRLLDVAAVCAAVQVVAVGVVALLQYLVDAPAPSEPAFGPGLVTFLLELAPGRALLAAALLAAVLSAAAIAVRSRRGAVVALWLALAALVPLALPAAAAGETLLDARAAIVAALLRTAALAAWAGLLVVGAPRGIRVAPVVVAVVSVLVAAVQRPEGAFVALAGVVVLAAVGALVARAPRARRAADRAQLVLLAVATGLAASPAVAEPSPVQVAARTSPAAILTGHELPAAPPALLWQPDALALSAVVLLLAAAVLLRPPTAVPLRTASWIGGALVLVVATCGAPAVLGEVHLSALVLQQALLVVAVPLLLAGTAPLQRLQQVRPAAAARLAAVLTRPWLAAGALVVWLLVLLGTDALRWSRTDALLGAAAPVVSLALGGLVVGSSIRSTGGASRIALPIVLALLGVGAGAALVLSPALVQAGWYGALGWGVDARIDQRAAGWIAAVVSIVGAVPLLLLGVRGRVDVAPPVQQEVAA